MPLSKYRYLQVGTDTLLSCFAKLTTDITCTDISDLRTPPFLSYFVNLITKLPCFGTCKPPTNTFENILHLENI